MEVSWWWSGVGQEYLHGAIAAKAHPNTAIPIRKEWIKVTSWPVQLYEVCEDAGS